MPPWAIGIIFIVSFWLFCATMKVLVQSISYRERKHRKRIRKSLKKSPPAQTKHNTRGNRTRGIYRSCMEGNQQIAAAEGTLKPHVLAYHCARSTSKRFPPPAQERGRAGRF